MKRMYKKNLSHMNQKLYFAETAESCIQMERFKDGVHENATINKRKTHLCSSCCCLLTIKWQYEYCKAIFFLSIFFFLHKSYRPYRSVMSNSLQPHGLYSPWTSPGQNIGVDSLSLLQGIFSTQESNPGLPHCRQNLYQLSHKGSPSILERVAYPFSSGSSWPRNWIRVSCIAGKFFTSWAIRETQAGMG